MSSLKSLKLRHKYVAKYAWCRDVREKENDWTLMTGKDNIMFFEAIIGSQ